MNQLEHQNTPKSMDKPHAQKVRLSSIIIYL
jgi:hypothetical protein